MFYVLPDLICSNIRVATPYSHIPMLTIPTCKSK